MKERPILMSGPMVRAILADTKTQTRRLVKPQPQPIDADRLAIGCDHDGSGVWWAGSGVGMMLQPSEMPCCCPYGRRGERLWVKETWRTDSQWCDSAPIELPETAPIAYEADLGGKNMLGAIQLGAVRQSIFMRRWMSRITLEITAVRVERLHAITEPDASAEGLIYNSGHLGPWSFEGGQDWLTAVDAYRELWNSINGDKDTPEKHWAANPWVWVVKFRRVQS